MLDQILAYILGFALVAAILGVAVEEWPLVVAVLFLFWWSYQ